MWCSALPCQQYMHVQPELVDNHQLINQFIWLSPADSHYVPIHSASNKILSIPTAGQSTTTPLGTFIKFCDELLVFLIKFPLKPPSILQHHTFPLHPLGRPIYISHKNEPDTNDSCHALVLQHLWSRCKHNRSAAMAAPKQPWGHWWVVALKCRRYHLPPP
jgi:hypothetical protein